METQHLPPSTIVRKFERNTFFVSSLLKFLFVYTETCCIIMCNHLCFQERKKTEVSWVETNENLLFRKSFEIKNKQNERSYSIEMKWP